MLLFIQFLLQYEIWADSSVWETIAAIHTDEY